jgi:predicted HicB family RNase H-like nuclease
MSDKVLNHNGYVGSIDMSLEDNCLYGKILHINDLINYEGRTPEELKQAFVAAVDFYLQKCKEKGLNPDKPFSGSFNVRMTSELHRSAFIQAACSGIALNEFVKNAVEFAVSEVKTAINENDHHEHMHVHTVATSSNEHFLEKQSQTWQQREKLH